MTYDHMTSLISSGLPDLLFQKYICYLSFYSLAVFIKHGYLLLPMFELLPNFCNPHCYSIPIHNHNSNEGFVAYLEGPSSLMIRLGELCIVKIPIVLDISQKTPSYIRSDCKCVYLCSHVMNYATIMTVMTKFDRVEYQGCRSEISDLTVLPDVRLIKMGINIHQE